MSEDILDTLVEVEIKEPDDFLKIKETLTRIGVASYKQKKLYQSCHILHKRGKYYIVHFKELFALDGKNSTLTQEDLERRNSIATLLQDWGLVKIINTNAVEEKAPLNTIKILHYSDKPNWTLETKYNIGTKR
jgi:hypothetical protein